MKKVAMCKGKKASNLNDIVIEEKWFLFWEQISIGV